MAKTIPNVKVIGLASASKHKAICLNGVDIPIDSLDPLWDKAVRSACPEGVDVALDSTSGDSFSRTQLLVRDLGRAILIGHSTGYFLSNKHDLKIIFHIAGANGMIEGETLGMWRIFRSWWNTKFIKPVDLIVNNRVVAGFHLTHVKSRSPQCYKEALEHLLELYQKKLIKLHIDSIWTFDQVRT